MAVVVFIISPARLFALSTETSTQILGRAAKLEIFIEASNEHKSAEVE